MAVSLFFCFLGIFLKKVKESPTGYESDEKLYYGLLRSRKTSYDRKNYHKLTSDGRYHVNKKIY